MTDFAMGDVGGRGEERGEGRGGREEETVRGRREREEGGERGRRGEMTSSITEAVREGRGTH